MKGAIDQIRKSHISEITHLPFLHITTPFPNEHGISRRLSPRDIVTGRRVEYKKHCQVLFGTYVQAVEDADITNNMKLWSRDYIALGPSGNLRGSQKVFCLNTGQGLKRRTIHEFPMPDRTVERMNQSGIRFKRETYGRKLQFLNRSKDKYDWDNDEFEEDEGLVEDTPLTRAEIKAEIPRIEMENEQMHITESPVQDQDITTGQQAEAAAENAQIELRETTRVVRQHTTGVYN